jgi:hypothetical protein
LNCFKDKVGDIERPNEQKCFISDKGLLAINKALIKNPFMTCQKIKNDLNLLASTCTIGKALRQIGWRKVTTKYCQIVEPRNRVK